VTLFRRRRFHDLVSRQLEVFATDEAGLLDEARGAEQSWNQAGRDEAEEAFGDWQLVVDAVAERLLDIRETYASTLDDESADEYRTAFSRVAVKRYREFAGLLD
jgi:hypothetical protein